MRNLTTILILPAMLFSACGTMKKLKEEGRFNHQAETDERVEVNGSMVLETNLLMKKLTEHGDRVTALIESDSVIAFDPQTGFELQGGRVLYRQASEGFSLLRASSDLAMERRADSVAELDVKEEVHVRSSATDKAREGRSAWFWPLLLFIGAIGISLLVLRKFKWS